MAARFAALLVGLLYCVSGAAYAAETDQYLVWGVQLEDSTDEVNAWLNDTLRDFLERRNTQPRRGNESADEVAVAFMRHVFSVRPLAHINELYNSSGLDEYPPREEVNFIEYQRMSIYRGPAFPFVLFMARTIRLGDVYLGIDKLSHVFGFGRRYFVDYLNLEAQGLDEAGIVPRLIEQGMRREMWFTGRAINGVISPSDLEANYQGLLFALSLCRGADAVLTNRDGDWVQTRPLDILPFVTPHMDESYYENRYWAARKRQVLPVIDEEYSPLEDSPLVKARFAVYDTYEASFNVVYVESLMEEDAPTDLRKDRSSLRN